LSTVNSFNLGKNVSLVLLAPNGSRVDLTILTAFKASQKIHDLVVHPLSGPPIGQYLPAGWEGEFTIERGNAAVDNLFIQIESGFWAGGDVGTGSIYQYVAERDGSQSTYQFDGVTMQHSDTGEWKAESSVKQTVKFFASTRKRI